MHRTSLYGQTISRYLDGRRYDPRHIEAYMRMEHPTLDGLPPWQFAQEVEIAICCIDEGGTDNAEQCARSYGL